MKELIETPNLSEEQREKIINVARVAIKNWAQRTLHINHMINIVLVVADTLKEKK
jgi:hypothetical protein